MADVDVSAADLRKLLSSLASLYGAQDERDYAARAVAVICDLVPNELAAFNQIDIPRKFSQFVASNPADPAFRDVSPFDAHVSEHPVIQHVARTGIFSPEQISDHRSLAEWSENPLHREFFVPNGHADEDQICFLLPGSDPKGSMCGFNMQRRWGGFTPRDRELINLLYPHLYNAQRAARRLAILRERSQVCEEALDRSAAAMVRVTAQGGVMWMTAAAEKLLLEASLPVSCDRLPVALEQWAAPMLAMLVHGNNVEALAGWSSLALETPKGQLTARATSQQDGGLLVTLHASWWSPAPEADAPPNPPLPRLTRRQEQILHLLADGLTVKEAAARLGITYNTAQEHVAHLYNILGVNTRGQLVARYFRSQQ